MQLIARDSNGTSAPLDFDAASRACRRRGRPAAAAPAVGVSRYAEASLNLDSRPRRLYLRRWPFGGKRHGEVATRPRRRSPATRRRAAAAAGVAGPPRPPAMTVIVFLAGHGAHDEGRYHFVTHDGDIARLAQTAISEAETARPAGRYPRPHGAVR
ncbi:MAG: hypothetical protein U1F25_16805 [Rubrivivax sp.]